MGKSPMKSVYIDHKALPIDPKDGSLYLIYRWFDWVVIRTGEIDFVNRSLGPPPRELAKIRLKFQDDLITMTFLVFDELETVNQLLEKIHEQFDLLYYETSIERGRDSVQKEKSEKSFPNPINFSLKTDPDNLISLNEHSTKNIESSNLEATPLILDAQQMKKFYISYNIETAKIIIQNYRAAYKEFKRSGGPALSTVFRNNG
jgi:hypothetical protein